MSRSGQTARVHSRPREVVEYRVKAGYRSVRPSTVFEYPRVVLVTRSSMSTTFSTANALADRPAPVLHRRWWARPFDTVLSESKCTAVCRCCLMRRLASMWASRVEYHGWSLGGRHKCRLPPQQQDCAYERWEAPRGITETGIIGKGWWMKMVLCVYIIAEPQLFSQGRGLDQAQAQTQVNRRPILDRYKLSLLARR